MELDSHTNPMILGDLIDEMAIGIFTVDAQGRFVGWIGPGSVSLEQQVRIAAGFLAAMGSALAFFVHPGFILVTAGAGVGLMHAGVTNSCIMGMMLSIDSSRSDRNPTPCSL